MKVKSTHKLTEGEHFTRPVNHPILYINGSGTQIHLWIGNNASGDKMCYATLSGRAHLRSVAESILEALRP